MHDIAGFTTEPLEEIMGEIMDVAERWRVKGLKIYVCWRNSRASSHHTRGIHRR